MIRVNFARVWNPAELVAHAADGEPVAPPGDGPSYYSNTNYALLGLIIEKASGMRLADAVRARVLVPLGAADTFFWGEPGRPEPVSGYYDDDGKRTDLSTVDLSAFWAAGDLLSTAADTATLLPRSPRRRSPLRRKPRPDDRRLPTAGRPPCRIRLRHHAHPAV